MWISSSIAGEGDRAALLSETFRGMQLSRPNCSALMIFLFEMELLDSKFRNLGLMTGALLVMLGLQLVRVESGDGDGDRIESRVAIVVCPQKQQPPSGTSSRANKTKRYHVDMMDKIK